MPQQELGQEVGYIVARTNRILELDLERRVKPLGLSVDQFRILRCLAETGALAMGELAERVFVEPANLTKIIDKMTRNGLVMRIPDERDRRRVLVSLSAYGAESGEALDAVARSHDVFARDALTLDAGAGPAEILSTLLSDQRAEKITG